MFNNLIMKSTLKYKGGLTKTLPPESEEPPLYINTYIEYIWYIENTNAIDTEGSKKMYSLFDNQYLWNKMTCSYNSCAVV
jgi:hypothetical protein